MDLRLPQADDPLCTAYLGEALPGLIQQLSREERQVLIGYFFDERTLAELARELEWRPERVVALLHGALRTLRRQLSSGSECSAPD